MKILDLGPLRAAIVMSLLSTTAWSQQQPPPPTPPLSTASGSIVVPDAMAPDDHPLSGAITPGLGTWGGRHSFYRPGFRIAEDLDTNPSLEGLEGSSLRGYCNMKGELQFVQFWSNDAEMRYSGAIRYNTDATQRVNEHFSDLQDLSLVKQFQGRRSTVVLSDQLYYSLYSNFAGAGMEGLGDLETPLDQMTGLGTMQLSSTSLQQQYLPSQTVLTERTSRISNAAVGELDYRLTGRGTATVTASYGLLQFPSAALIDSNQSLISAGYNYKRSALDTFALEYDFGYFRFPGEGTDIRNHFVQVEYSRRITGRLSASGGIGPQFTLVQAKQQEHSIVTWQGQGNIQYRQGRLAARVGASRLLTSGAGVAYGSQTEGVQGGLAYDMSRRLASSLNFGLSRNQDLLTGRTISLEYANVTLTRRTGRYATFFLTYYVAHQLSSENCVGLLCQPTGTRQVGGIGFSWSYRPIPINF
jgi:hypothetical protein